MRENTTPPFLRDDGRMVTCGANGYGQCVVPDGVRAAPSEDLSWQLDQIVQLFLEPDAQQWCICTLRGINGEQRRSKFCVPALDSLVQRTLEERVPPGRQRLSVLVPGLGRLPRSMGWWELLNRVLPGHIDRLTAHSQ